MDQQAISNLGQPEAAESFPRLSINHLLLLTLTVAFSLACVAPSLEDALRLGNEQLAADYRWRTIVGTVTDAVASGIKVFALIVLLRGWMRGRRLATAPGHWYFLILGPYIVVGLVSNPLFGLLTFAWDQRYATEINAAHNALSAAMFLVCMIVCTKGLLRTPGLRWKTCLAILWAWLACITLLSGSWVIENLSPWPSRWHHQHLLAMWGNLQFAFAASFFIAALIEGAHHVRRDWLHYLAIATILLDSMTAAASFGPMLQRWWSSAIAHLIG